MKMPGTKWPEVRFFTWRIATMAKTTRTVDEEHKKDGTDRAPEPPGTADKGPADTREAVPGEHGVAESTKKEREKDRGAADG
jgi:hypothetical protein